MLSRSKYAILALLLLLSNALCTPMETVKNVKEAEQFAKTKIPTENPFKSMPHRDTSTPAYSDRPGHRPTSNRGTNPSDPSSPKPPTPEQKAYMYGISWGPGGKAASYVWRHAKSLFWFISRPFKWMFTPLRKNAASSLTEEELAALARSMGEKPDLHQTGKPHAA